MHEDELGRLSEEQKKAKQARREYYMTHCDMCGVKTRISRKLCSECQKLQREVESLHYSLCGHEKSYLNSTKNSLYEIIDDF